MNGDSLSMNDPIGRQDESAPPPSEAQEAGKPHSTLEAMRRQLEEHSPLEDLGPLFGPKAQGKS